MSAFLRTIQKNTFKLRGQKHNALDMAHNRSLVILCFFLLLFGLVGVRVFDLTYLTQAVSVVENVIKTNQEKVATPRGEIYDRNGMLLASNIRIKQLYADPHFIEKKQAVLNDLKRVYPGLDHQALKEDLFSKKRFVLVKGEVTPEEEKQVLALGHPGLYFREVYKRVYPHGKALAHLIGFTGKDGQGLEGIERQFEKKLSQNKSLNLSIDTRYQYIAHKALKYKMNMHQAKAGSAVVMDIESGEILAASSLPDYDPNVFEKSSARTRYNTLFKGVYEMGSTFKIFSTAAALEEKGFSYAKSYDATKPLKRGRFEINDYHGEERVLTIPEIFIHSSNIGSALIGEEIGSDTLRAFYKDLGLFDRVDIDGMVSAQPIIPSPWREITTITASYGHGIAVTPMHVVQAVASIANQGNRVQPHILKQEQDKSIQAINVMSAENAKKIQQLMRLTVIQGTATHANVEGYGVGGKTGTAEKIGSNGRYDKTKLLSSFVSFFPSDNPKYLVFAMLDEPKGAKETYNYATAGWTAVPVVAEIIEGVAKISAIPADYDESRDRDFLREARIYIHDEEVKSKAINDNHNNNNNRRVTLASQ